jgi:serine/threonine protein kinase
MNIFRKIVKTVGVGVEMCGDGAYGEVYKALDLHTNKHVALKRLKSNADDKGIPANALREFTLLKALQVRL